MKLERLANEWNLLVSRKPKAVLELVVSPEFKEANPALFSGASIDAILAQHARTRTRMADESYFTGDTAVNMALSCSYGERDAAWFARKARWYALLASISIRQWPDVNTLASQGFSNSFFDYLETVMAEFKDDPTAQNYLAHSYLFGARHAFSAARMPKLVELVDFIKEGYKREFGAADAAANK